MLLHTRCGAHTSLTCLIYFMLTPDLSLEDHTFPSLRKQPTFREVATWAFAKWRLSNKRRNSILMMCTTQILVVLLIGCAHKGIFFQPIRSTAKIWVVHVISMKLLCSLLRRRFVRAQVANLQNVGCFLRLLISTDQCKQSDCFAVCSPPRCINGNSKPLGNLTKWWGVG